VEKPEDRENLENLSKDGGGDNIQVNPKEIGWKGVDWIHMAQDRDKWWTRLKRIINSQVPWGGGGGGCKKRKIILLKKIPLSW